MQKWSRMSQLASKKTYLDILPTMFLFNNQQLQKISNRPLKYQTTSQLTTPLSNICFSRYRKLCIRFRCNFNKVVYGVDEDTADTMNVVMYQVVENHANTVIMEIWTVHLSRCSLQDAYIFTSRQFHNRKQYARQLPQYY